MRHGRRCSAVIAEQVEPLLETLHEIELGELDTQERDQGSDDAN